MLASRDCTIWRIFGEERAKDRASCPFRYFGIVESVHESRYPKHIGEEDELLSNRAAGLTCASEKVDCGHPFPCGKTL